MIHNHRRLRGLLVLIATLLANIACGYLGPSAPATAPSVLRLFAGPTATPAPDLLSEEAVRYKLTGHSGEITSLAWSPASATLALAGGGEGAVLLWRVKP